MMKKYTKAAMVATLLATTAMGSDSALKRRDSFKALEQYRGNQIPENDQIFYKDPDDRSQLRHKVDMSDIKAAGDSTRTLIIAKTEPLTSNAPSSAIMDSTLLANKIHNIAIPLIRNGKLNNDNIYEYTSTNIMPLANVLIEKGSSNPTDDDAFIVVAEKTLFGGSLYSMPVEALISSLLSIRDWTFVKQMLIHHHKQGFNEKMFYQDFMLWLYNQKLCPIDYLPEELRARVKSMSIPQKEISKASQDERDVQIRILESQLTNLRKLFEQNRISESDYLAQLDNINTGISRLANGH